MRYKFLLCALVLLIATPAQTQEFSPIVVETGKPTPSVVRSGESFKITYRAKFFDTVLIYEEQMVPDSLVLEKVEVIGLEVVKERVSNDTLGYVNVWDFTYTFRIIQPEKGIYKIPLFNFIWVEKKAGVTVEETKNKEKPREMPTEEVGVGYVSTVNPANKAVKPPPLDIRDEIIFVNPLPAGYQLRRWAYGVMGGAFLIFMLVIFRFYRDSKIRQSQETGQEVGAEIGEDEDIVKVEPILSAKPARSKFLRDLKKLRAESRLDLMKKIRPLVRSLLLAEFRGTIRDSMSENEIYSKLNGLDIKKKKEIGSKYEVMLDFARKLKGYQEDIDLDKYSLDAVNWREVVELSEAISGLKFRKSKKVWSFVKWIVRAK